jgi:hypothetical protein
MTGREGSRRSAGAILDRLAGEEASAVLRKLLETHLELRPEAERIASGLISSQSVEDIAARLAIECCVEAVRWSPGEWGVRGRERSGM